MLRRGGAHAKPCGVRRVQRYCSSCSLASGRSFRRRKDVQRALRSGSFDFERLRIFSRDDIEAVRAEVECRLAALGRRPYGVVKYDDFDLPAELEDAWAEMVPAVVSRYCSNVTRYGARGFLRAKLGAALAARGVAPQLCYSAAEAGAWLRTERVGRSLVAAPRGDEAAVSAPAPNLRLRYRASAAARARRSTS